MINFRYHVVSLTAVFLALAIGLVVGTAALNGPVADSFKDTVDGLKRDNSQLRAQLEQLEDEVSREGDFAVEAAPALVGGKLTGRRVLLVVLPRTEDYVDGVAAMLTVAGARITGRINVQDKFLAPANNVELLDLADQASQPTVSSSGLPLNSDGVETSSALLAKALLEGPQPVAPADLKAVLAAYSSAGYLTADEETTGGAEAAVVVSGLPPLDREADAKNRAAVTLVTQFAGDRPLVVAGSGVGEGNVVSQVRADPALVRGISTVDNAGTSQGQLVTALAAAERIAQGQAGQYGLGPGATSLMPKVAS